MQVLDNLLLSNDLLSCNITSLLIKGNKSTIWQQHTRIIKYHVYLIHFIVLVKQVIFFGDDTYEHYFYINGNKKNIGKYTYQKCLIYKNFVSLLNRASSIHYTEITNMLARKKIKKICSLLDSLTLDQIIGDWTSSPTFKFVDDGYWRLNGFREPYKENGQYINYVDIDFITDKGNVFCSFRDHIEMIDLSREEYNCILNYIRVYFLVNLHWMGRTEKFIIGNDP